MTPYRFANQEKKKNVSRTKIVVVAVFLVVIILLSVFVVRPLLQSLSRGPMWLARNVETGVTETLSLMTPKALLLDKNKELEARIAAYDAQVIELQQLREENEQLKKQVGLVQHPAEVVTAQVLGKPNQSLVNSMVINGGKEEGIHEGQLVTTQGNLGIGIIAGVAAHTAVVELFGGPQFAGDVLLVTKGITVPATGKGGGNFEIHIPREVVVEDGDLLAFPENPAVAIGVVKSIIFDPRDPFQTVLARAPVNVQELRFVQVVK